MFIFLPANAYLCQFISIIFTYCMLCDVYHTRAFHVVKSNKQHTLSYKFNNYYLSILHNNTTQIQYLYKYLLNTITNSTHTHIQNTRKTQLACSHNIPTRTNEPVIMNTCLKTYLTKFFYYKIILPILITNNTVRNKYKLNSCLQPVSLYLRCKYYCNYCLRVNLLFSYCVILDLPSYFNVIKIPISS